MEAKLAARSQKPGGSETPTNQTITERSITFMADLAVTVDIALDEIKTELTGLKSAKEAEIEAVRKKFEDRKKALFAKKAKLGRMLKTAKAL